MTDIMPTKTEPWSSANQTDMDKLSNEIQYPTLNGMKVMLITPNDFYRKKVFGLGSAYIATAMKRCGIEVSTLSCDVWSYDDIEIAKILIQSGVTIFGIGAMYPMIQEVKRICDIIRAVIPSATIILGGSLPSPIPEFVLRKTRADIAAIGEAELTIPDLMSALAGEMNLENVKGVAYINQDGTYFYNGKPDLPKYATKKEIGWPAWDLFPTEKYITAPKFYPFDQTARIMTISSGRGCPYSCNFCYRVCAYRIRPFNEILDEMEYLVDRYNLDGFYFVDDLLLINEKKVKAICEGILERGMKIKFNMSGRVNTVSTETVKILKDAGCISIYYGIESGNNEILKKMSKKTTVEQIHNAIRLTREHGIYCTYGFMFGQPGENKTTLQDTVNLIKEISYGEYRAQKIFGCIPFPGSGLYDWCKKTGRIKDDEYFYNHYICQDWSLDQIPVNMTELSDEELEQSFRNANEELNKFFIEKMSKDWVNFFSKN